MESVRIFQGRRVGAGTIITTVDVCVETGDVTTACLFADGTNAGQAVFTTDEFALVSYLSKGVVAYNEFFNGSLTKEQLRAKQAFADSCDADFEQTGDNYRALLNLAVRVAR